MTGPGEQPLVLGTAGHIDHGKTVLVKALTGVDTDRLPEERERGISIELGFARLVLPSGRELGVVDVPGHERFVRTMVAGATGIDLFLLVVAADDGVMPQTREHLTVLEALGVPRGVVAVTKADAVGPEEAELARAEVAELLAAGPYPDAEIVKVSARRGDGLVELLAALERAAAGGRAPGPPVDAARAPARLHVDRSFTLRGIGTVVTGTLWSGELRPGMDVLIEPGGRHARVRGVEVHDRGVERAVAGQRVALNLAGIARDQIDRGDVVTSGAGLAATYLVDARVELRAGAAALRRGARVHVHHGTRETPARVAPLEGNVLAPGVPAFTQLRLERPIVPAAGDRMVIRQVAPPDTVGGAVVIDPHPRKHGPGEPHVRRLAALASGDPLERLAVALAEARSGLAGEDPELLERLAESGRARRAGERWFAPAQLDDVEARLLEALAGANGRPLSRGALATAGGVDEPAAAAVLERLAQQGAVRRLGPGFAATAPGTQAADPLAARIVELLGGDGVEPRAPGALAEAVGAPHDRVRETLDRLALEDGLVRVRPDLYYHRDGLEHARRTVISLCERDGAVTIARLRDELGTSRKYAQALLERFDSERVTLRRGDEHILRRHL